MSHADRTRDRGCLGRLSGRMRMGGAAASYDQVVSASWQPLSARLGGKPINQTWQEGIPQWIDAAVRSWLSEKLAVNRTRNLLFARLHYEPSMVPMPRTMSPLVNELDEQNLL